MKEKISRFIQAFQMNGQVKRRTLTIGGIVLAVIVVVILLICLLPRGQEPEPEPEATDTDVVERVDPDPIVAPEGMEETLEKYPDVYTWIEIPGTAAVLGTDKDLSYPVAQHPTDRSFYLNHDLDGNKSQPGTLFTESFAEDKYINGVTLDDPVTVIYGHNQANRTMFGGLQTYMGKMNYSDPQYIYMYLSTVDGLRRMTYQIVGGVQYDTSHIIYYHDFTNADVFNDFFSQLWKETDSTTNLDGTNRPVAGDKVLILSVCKNGDDHHRYLVVAKLVEDTADPETWAIATDTSATQTNATKTNAAK